MLTSKEKRHYNGLRRYLSHDEAMEIIEHQRVCFEARIISEAKKAEYRKRNRLKAYLLSDVEYNKMVEESEGRCCICHNERKLVIDHNHSTGKVRGLICGKCNAVLGFSEDNIDVLMSAVTYLKTR